MKIAVQAHVREQSGKGVARKLRQSGKIPAVLYGKGKPVPLTMDPSSVGEILHSTAGTTAIISLSLVGADEADTRVALLWDYQRDPLTGDVLHADLFEVSMDKPIRLKVPVHIVGETPLGIKEGGIVQHYLREVNIECNPANIPEHIEVDASTLRIGHTVHVGDLTPGEGVTILDDARQYVVSVTMPISAEKFEALLTTGAPAEGPAEPVAGAEEKEKEKTEA